MSPNASVRRAVVAACACALAVTAAPAAQAQPVHQVSPGESLWQIATQNGLSPSALAAANGLAPDAAVRAGQSVRIPAAGGAATAAPSGAATGTGSTAAGPGAATPAAPAPSAGSGSGPGTTSGSDASSGGGQAGSIVVQPGDSLTVIAGRAGVSVSRLAAYNGLTQSAVLPAGRALALPAPGSSGPATGAPTTGAATPATASSGTASSGAATGTTSTTGSASAGTTGSGAATSATAATPGAAPSSGTRVSAADIGSAAAANGVPSSLARAIAWQESGFNNGAISSAGARGVMQVMPGTWSWIDANLSSRRLDPGSAADNVHAGTLYLQHLLRETGGDADQAAAAYYQGLSSVRSRGLYDDTKRYVESVRALRGRFGG